MYKNILIATDGSDLADEAVQHGLSLAKEQNSKVIIVTVTEPWSLLEMTAHIESAGWENPIEEYQNVEAAAANKVLTSATDLAENSGVDYKTQHVKDNHPAEGIIEAANSNKSDLIIMASHGRRGIKKVILGSVANEVVSHSPIPVLIVR